MRLNNRSFLLSASTVLLLSALACNLPAISTSADVPATEIPLLAAPPSIALSEAPAVETPPVSTLQSPLAPTIESSQAPTVESSLAPTAETVPTADATDAIVTNLPTITLAGGSGYVFSSQEISRDDRDLWWNAVQFVPDRTVRMVSLGIITSPADVDEIAFAGQSPPVFVPAVGEGFALEIARGNETNYAVIRVVAMDGDRKITFDWVYPYGGRVSNGP